MKKFYIPQIEDETTEQQQENSNAQASKQTSQEPKKEYQRDRFVSPYYGSKVKDEITVMGAKFGNRGAQYDSFRKPEDRIRQDDYLDYVTYREETKVSARSDISEEERRRPSYLEKDPAYKDLYETPKKVEEEPDTSFVRAEEVDEPVMVSKTQAVEEEEAELPRFEKVVTPKVEEETGESLYEASDLEDSIVDTEMDDLEIDFGEKKQFSSLDDEEEDTDIFEEEVK